MSAFSGSAADSLDEAGSCPTGVRSTGSMLFRRNCCTSVWLGDSFCYRHSPVIACARTSPEGTVRWHFPDRLFYLGSINDPCGARRGVEVLLHRGLRGDPDRERAFVRGSTRQLRAVVGWDGLQRNLDCLPNWSATDKNKKPEPTGLRLFSAGRPETCSGKAGSSSRLGRAQGLFFREGFTSSNKATVSISISNDHALSQLSQ